MVQQLCSKMALGTVCMFYVCVCGFSLDFLPQSKNMNVRLTGNSKLFLCVCVRERVCEWLLGFLSLCGSVMDR